MADKQLPSRGGVVQTHRDNADGSFAEEYSSQLRAWDATSLSWVKVLADHTSGALSVTGGAGGGGGGAVTIADGANVTQGSTTDLSSANTVVGILKAIKAALTGTLTTSATVSNFPATQAVSLASAPTTAVTGPLTDTQMRATPVPTSLSSLPSLAAGSAVIGHVIVDTAPTTPVTAASLPLPTGAATDTTYTAAMGSAADTPAAYTVLDQLTKLRKAAEAELKAVQQLVALQTPAVARKTQPTLLHRS